MPGVLSFGFWPENEIRQKKDNIVTTVTIQEAQSRLSDLIHNLVPGDEVVITENNQAVAKLVSELPKPKLLKLR